MDANGRARNMRGGDAFARIVGAWASPNGVVTGQIKTDKSSDEIADPLSSTTRETPENSS